MCEVLGEGQGLPVSECVNGEGADVFRRIAKMELMAVQILSGEVSSANRRMPNGTSGGVGGDEKLGLDPVSLSYPICLLWR